MRVALLGLAACGAAQRTEVPACTAETVVTLGGQDDVEAAAACSTVAKLVIRTGAPLDLTPLAKLHVVRGEVVVGPTVGFEELTLPALQSVGSLAVRGNGNLHGVFLPKLASAGAVTIDANVALTTIALPRLSRAESIAIRDNSELGFVNLSALATAGDLVVSNNRALTLLEIGALERARSVIVENTALSTDVVDALRAKAVSSAP